MNTYYCLFEQSGTFKNEFIKLGHKAYDFDMRNEYLQTDYQCDLFNINTIYKIIEKAKQNNATIIMFFPCTYFSEQQILWTKGNNYAQRKWSNEEKIRKSNNNIKYTSLFYSKLCLWVNLCIREKIPLIIENPYSEQSFLVRYFPIKPTIIDRDRRNLGDKFKKPTMWFFINRKPSDNLYLLEAIYSEHKAVAYTKYGKERSEITQLYAHNFIKSFIL